MIRRLIRIDHKLSYTILSLIEVFWGLWYMNPALQDSLARQFICPTTYFDPPVLLGLAAVALGVFSLITIHSKFYRRFFGILHIMFWSYVTFSILLGGVVSAGAPLYIVLLASSILFYVVSGLGD